MSSDAATPLVAEVRNIPVAYEVRGEGSPVLIVHGWSADRRYMIADLEPVFAREPGWRRIYLDLPGHGATPAPPWLSTQDDVLAVLTDFIDATVGRERFAVVGSSYGGHTVLAIARLMPERILGAALIVPDMPARDGSRDVAERVVLVEDRGVFHDLESDEQWMPDALVVHERWMVDELRAHDVPAYRAADHTFLDRLEAHYLPTGAAAEPGEPLAVPCLIITGRQDATVGYRSAWNLLDEFPRATYAVLDMAGHQLGRVERATVFGTLVADWLDRMRRQPSVGRGGAADPETRATKA